MQSFNIFNILNQALNPSRFKVMYDKVLKRLFSGEQTLDKKENLKWIKENISDLSDFGKQISQTIWSESLKESKVIESRAYKVLDSIKYDLGGGGAYPLIYFLTRVIKPNVVLETGVAAGFSSYSILSALNRNAKGKLFSSDFPYFRIKDPEKYIGIVVDNKLKNNWELYIEGDSNNLKKILSCVDEVDLFIYDSDKSYVGKKETFSKVTPFLSDEAVILIDDIEDDSFFYDFVKENEIYNWKIFEFEGKFCGLIGNLRIL